MSAPTTPPPPPGPPSPVPPPAPAAPPHAHGHPATRLAPGVALPLSKRPAGVEAIILYKLFKSVLSTCIGVTALLTLNVGAEALSATLAQVLLDHFAQGWALQLATLIVVAGTTMHVRLAAIAAFADATLSIIEGLALRAGRWWAPWLVVIATGALLPWELFEVFKHPQWGRFLLLAINLAVVVYLVAGEIKEHRERGDRE